MYVFIAKHTKVMMKINNKNRQNKNYPLVSVIIPSYNHEKYIKEAILSVINQTYKNIELIVIDDGSTDNSFEIIQKLSKEHNFVCMKQKNSGVSKTLNIGITAAKGEFLSLLASDDIYVENKIEKQVFFLLNNNDYGIVCSNMIKFYEIGYEKKIKSLNPCSYSGDLFSGFLCRKQNIFSVTVMYRKKVFDDVGLFDENLQVEDFDMLLRIAKKYEIGFIDEYLTYYRSHQNNTLNKVGKMKENFEAILDKWKDEPKYNDAFFYNELLFFRAYSSLEKIKALKTLPLNFKIFREKVFYEGIIRLIIPKFIYRKIMKR